jgi:hypothetical protein
MRSPIAAIKTLWHRDLVADPATHAWVLNLYRAGEHHHQTVLDYFPVAHAPSADLADEMGRHAHDEERHDRMYATAIRRLGHALVAVRPNAVFNHVIRRYTPVSFAIEPDDDADVRRRKVANFLAHAHFLEKRIARSLTFHVEACDRQAREREGTVVAAVMRDEDRHVRYTREGATDLLTRAEADAVFALHRRAEARANLAFSSEQVKDFLARFPDATSRQHRAMYGFCAWLMTEAIDHV